MAGQPRWKASMVLEKENKNVLETGRKLRTEVVQHSKNQCTWRELKSKETKKRGQSAI